MYKEIDTLFQENKIKGAYGHERPPPAGLRRSVGGLLRYYPGDEENRVASLLIYTGGELGATMNDDRPNNKSVNIIYTHRLPEPVQKGEGNDEASSGPLCATWQVETQPQSA